MTTATQKGDKWEREFEQILEATKHLHHRAARKASQRPLMETGLDGKKHPAYKDGRIVLVPSTKGHDIFECADFVAIPHGGGKVRFINVTSEDGASARKRNFPIQYFDGDHMTFEVAARIPKKRHFQMWKFNGDEWVKEELMVIKGDTVIEHRPEEVGRLF